MPSSASEEFEKMINENANVPMDEMNNIIEELLGITADDKRVMKLARGFYADKFDLLMLMVLQTTDFSNPEDMVRAFRSFAVTVLSQYIKEQEGK